MNNPILSRTQQLFLKSSRIPKIAPGSSSNSEVLNEWFYAVAEDLRVITQRLAVVNGELNLGQQIATTQGAILSTMMAGLSNTLDSLTGSGNVLVGFHMDNHLHNDNDAEVNHVFGQVTLPVSSSTNVLTFQDSFGRSVKHPQTKCYFAWVEGGGEPGIGDYILDPSGDNMIKEEAPWIVGFPGGDVGNLDLWLRIDFPYEFFALRPNVVEIYPAPCFALTIKQVDYLAQGSSLTNGWSPVGFDYATRYNPALYSNPYINFAGPIRLYLPTNTDVSSIRIRVALRTPSPAGLAYFRLISNEYSPTASLKITNPYGYNIGVTQVLGRYPSDLTALPQTIDGTDLTISLSSNSSKETPVITGVILSQ